MASEPERFAQDWLTLREPVDHAARPESLARLLDGWIADRTVADDGVRILDLGAGAGSNLRWLGPRLHAHQRWLLADHDAALLERAARSTPSAGAGDERIDVEARCLDLSGIGAELFENVDVVSASAFFDLASGPWLERLARRVAASDAAALFALTVDGGRWFTDLDDCVKESSQDVAFSELFNRHQQRGKGLGAALGPRAASRLPAALEAAGLTVRVERSDWVLRAGQEATATLGTALLEDWARAAAEQSPAQAATIESWLCRRRGALEAGRIGVGVGHVDVLALPERSRG